MFLSPWLFSWADGVLSPGLSPQLPVTDSKKLNVMWNVDGAGDGGAFLEKKKKNVARLR